MFVSLGKSLITKLCNIVFLQKYTFFLESAKKKQKIISYHLLINCSSAIHYIHVHAIEGEHEATLTKLFIYGLVHVEKHSPVV